MTETCSTCGREATDPDALICSNPFHLEHEHQWVLAYTSEDWWDGDEVDNYKCKVEWCTSTKKEYIPR